MFARIALASAGATVFAGTAYVVGIVAAPAPAFKVSHESRLSTFEDIADVYEKKTKKQEFYLGIYRLRRRVLTEHAGGRVLEVGAGTGNNVGLYPPDKVDEVILSDRAAAMVRASADKIIGKLQYMPYRYPDLSAADPAVRGPERLDRAARLKEQRASEQLIAQKTKERGGSSSVSSTSNKEGPIGDTTTATADESGCLQPTANGKKFLVSLVADLGAEAKAELASRRLTITQLSRDRQNAARAAAAALAAKKGGAEANPPPAPAASTSNTMLLEARRKKLYAIANYPAEHLPFADDEFDTVVDMFGLCSFQDPVAALAEMSRVCKPKGKVLLLEHGRGTWDRMNWYLDKWAPRHAAQWGCWWNRDIRRAVRTAGLEIVAKEEKHFGTTQLFVCAPYKPMRVLETVGRK